MSKRNVRLDLDQFEVDDLLYAAEYLEGFLHVIGVLEGKRDAWRDMRRVTARLRELHKRGSERDAVDVAA